MDNVYYDEFLSIDYEGDKYVISKNPIIGAISREDIVRLYKDLKRTKPRQIPLNEYAIKECDNGGCNFVGILHNRQTFCPLCKHIISVIDDDPDRAFDVYLHEWEAKMKFMESIINGDIAKFVDEFNESHKKDDDIMGIIGPEVRVNE